MKRVTVFALLAALLALLGCGSSSGTDTGSEISHAAYVVKTDARCEADLAREEALSNGASELTENIENGDPELRHKIEELGETERDLTGKRRADLAAIQAQAPPAADKQALEEIYAATESTFAATLAWARALEAEQSGVDGTLAKRVSAKEREVEHLSRQFGFTVCGGIHY